MSHYPSITLSLDTYLATYLSEYLFEFLAGLRHYLALRHNHWVCYCGRDKLRNRTRAPTAQ